LKYGVIFHPPTSLGLGEIITKSRRIKWAGHVARMEKWYAHRLLARNPERKRPLGRPRHRWLDNIKLNLGEVGWGDVDCIGLAQDRNRWRAVVTAIMNFMVT
jgi:hypothetical protein